MCHTRRKNPTVPAPMERQHVNLRKPSCAKSMVLVPMATFRASEIFFFLIQLPNPNSHLQHGGNKSLGSIFCNPNMLPPWPGHVLIYSSFLVVLVKPKLKVVMFDQLWWTNICCNEVWGKTFLTIQLTWNIRYLLKSKTLVEKSSISFSLAKPLISPVLLHMKHAWHS